MKALTKAEILDRETLTTSESAPEIMAIAYRYRHDAEMTRAAHAAINAIWPGYYPSSNSLARAMAEIERSAAVDESPLILVPVPSFRMQAGHTYLAATYGDSAIMGAVIQGHADPAKAEPYTHLFRIERRR